MPVEITIDIEQVHPEVRRSIIRGLQHEDRARYALGVVEQLKLKKFHDQVAAAGCNGEMRLGMVMSEGQRMEAMRQYGQMCFADPDFSPWLLKKHEDFRVKDVGTRVQSGYTGRDTRVAWWQRHRPHVLRGGGKRG